ALPHAGDDHASRTAKQQLDSPLKGRSHRTANPVRQRAQRLRLNPHHVLARMFHDLVCRTKDVSTRIPTARRTLPLKEFTNIRGPKVGFGMLNAGHYARKSVFRACAPALLSVLCGARLLHRPSALRSDPLPR